MKEVNRMKDVGIIVLDNVKQRMLNLAQLQVDAHPLSYVSNSVYTSIAFITRINLSVNAKIKRESK